MTYFFSTARDVKLLIDRILHPAQSLSMRSGKDGGQVLWTPLKGTAMRRLSPETESPNCHPVGLVDNAQLRAILDTLSPGRGHKRGSA